MLKIAAHDTPALRRFGWQMALAITGLFGLLLPWLFGFALPVWPWGLSALLLLLSCWAPKLLYWPARVWLALAAVLGWLNTRLLLGVVFYVLLTPLGLLLRGLGKLDYQRRVPGSSYWRDAPPIDDDNMKDPF